MKIKLPRFPERMPTTTEVPKRFEDPRLSALIVLVLGTVVTIGANILHAEPIFWAKALSASIPLILFFAAHTAAYAKSVVVRATMIPVSVITFAISYDHMNSLAMRYEENYEVAKLYPLAIDGAMLVATLCLAFYRRPEISPAEEDDPTADLELTNLDVVAFTWPSGALALVDRDERPSLVRKEVNAYRKTHGGPLINQKTAAKLVRDYEEEYVS